MKDSDILLDALQLKRNILMAKRHSHKRRIENYEEKLAPTTIFGHNISTINRVTSGYCIEQINISDSAVWILDRQVWEIDNLITSISKEALIHEQKDLGREGYKSGSNFYEIKPTGSLIIEAPNGVLGVPDHICIPSKDFKTLIKYMEEQS